MTPKALWAKFSELFPDVVPMIFKYVSVSPDTIMLYFRNGKKVRFTMPKDGNWELKSER